MTSIERVQKLVQDAIRENDDVLDGFEMAAAAVLDVIPDGWAKVDGRWVNITRDQRLMRRGDDDKYALVDLFYVPVEAG